MGNPSAVRIKNLMPPERCAEGGGLILDLKAPGRGHWTVRAQYGGKRRDIGLGSLELLLRSLWATAVKPWPLYTSDTDDE